MQPFVGHFDDLVKEEGRRDRTVVEWPEEFVGKFSWPKMTTYTIHGRTVPFKNELEMLFRERIN